MSMGPTTHPRGSPGLEPGGDVPAREAPGREKHLEVGPRRAPPERAKGPLNAIFTVIVLMATFFPVYELLVRLHLSRRLAEYAPGRSHPTSSVAPQRLTPGFTNQRRHGLAAPAVPPRPPSVPPGAPPPR
ncbi:DUF6480 family protein [Streptomyces sp. NPDC057284]